MARTAYSVRAEMSTSAFCRTDARPIGVGTRAYPRSASADRARRCLRSAQRGVARLRWRQSGRAWVAPGEDGLALRQPEGVGLGPGDLRGEPRDRSRRAGRSAPRTRAGRRARPRPRRPRATRRPGRRSAGARSRLRSRAMSCGRTSCAAEPGHRPEEGHHEVVGGAVVEGHRVAHLLDPALVEHRDPVGDVERLLLVVGDQHGGHVDLVVQPAQPLPQVGAHLGVEGAERLVEEQHLGVDREGPGQGHPLALAAGELGRVAVLEPVEPDDLEQVVDLARDLGLGPLADGQPEGDVVAHGHVLERRIVLEDEPDAALLRGDAGDVAAADDDASAVELLEPGDRAQQRRLARAARARAGR